MCRGVKFETLKSVFKITLLFHRGTSIRGFASKYIVFNTKLVTGPDMLPMQTSACIFNTGKCSLCRPQRALFSPEDVTYTDVSVHFSVRKMFRMQISACTFQSGRCMGLGHEGLRVIRADIDHQPTS